MGKILFTVLAGAAIAGVVYYMTDPEGAKKLIGDVKDAASDALGKMNEHWDKVEETVNNTINSTLSKA